MVGWMDGWLNSGLHDCICRVIGQEIEEKSSSDGSNQEQACGENDNDNSEC